MKYAIVTDTHAGVRADQTAFADYQDRFWENEFFPEVKSRGIKNIIHLGDFFDRRQFITLKTMERVNQTFVRLLNENELELDMITGNHDVLYRNTNSINSPEFLFKSYKNIRIHTTPVELDGRITLIPWINKENFDDFMNHIKSTSAVHCFGHFEINGFEMHRGSVCDGGLDVSVFDRFQTVLSGHFHTRSQRGNITYLGSPFELTWADYNDPKGWHIFDTDTGELEFIPSKESMFFRCEYSETNRVWTPYMSESLSTKFVKVVIKQKGNVYEFDKWLKKITQYGPSDIQVVESAVEVTGVELNLDELEQRSKSNIDIIRDYVQNMELDDDTKKKVIEQMQTLYSEALAV